MTTGTSAARLRQIDRERLQFAFGRLPELAARGERLYVFAHFLAPHPPFVVTRTGSDTGEARYFGQFSANHLINPDGITRAEYTHRFGEQLRWVNARLQEAITDVLSTAALPPIILIHGDHGPGGYFSHDNWRESYLHDRMAVLNAFHLPAWVQTPDPSSSRNVDRPAVTAFTEPYPSISLVNSYRLLLNRYFGTEFGRLPDRSFYATAAQPYRFVAIQGRLDSPNDRVRLERLESEHYFPSDR